MKRMYFLALSLVLSVFLVACQSQKPTEKSLEKNYTAMLIIEFSGEKKDSQKVEFKEGDKVVDILEKDHKVELKSGMVTAIDGVKQDEATFTYWMYDVNGEMAPKGVEEQVVKDGDDIKFYLQTYK